MPVPAQQRVLKDRRTKNLTRRLKPGDIAVIHHADLDTTAAHVLIECKVSAVVNAAQSITGRYPNRGPALLLDAGIALLDGAGDKAFDAIPTGALGVVEGDTLVLQNGTRICGEVMTPQRMAEKMAVARENLNTELDHFARNTLSFLDNEKGLLFDPVDAPRLATTIADRHVLIVVRGEGYKADLGMLSDYLVDARPILLAVDGGADALLEAKLKPDIILGDMDSVSDAALRCGAELIVHGYPHGDERGAPGLARIEQLGLKAKVFRAQGTSEDIAMLLADELGARVIVAVGTHFSLEEFLDKGRAGMASTFLTRLRIGSKLVDAKGVARLSERQRPRVSELLFLGFAFTTPIIAVAVLSPMGQVMLRWLTVWFQHTVHGRH